MTSITTEVPSIAPGVRAITVTTATGETSNGWSFTVENEPPNGDPGGSPEYYHQDAIGSIRMITNSAGAVIRRFDYLPFGQEVGGTNTDANNLRFTGHERDRETEFGSWSALDYFGVRYYQGQTGRFTAVDPIVTLQDNLFDPQRWNRYVYVRNNPFRYVDPDGRQSQRVEEAAQGTAYAWSATFLWENLMRTLYKDGKSQLPLNEAGVNARQDLKATVRKFSTPFGRTLAEAMDRDPWANKTTAQLTGSVRGGRVAADRAAAAFGIAGSSLYVASAGLSVYNVTSAPAGQRGRVAASEVGGMAGGFGGGYLGGVLGASIGELVCAGAPPCGVAGAMIGTTLLGGGGAIAGRKAAESLYDATKP